MKKVIISIFFVFAIFSINGCKKDNPVQPEPTPTPIVDSGWTDSQGKVLLNLSNYQIDATIKDSTTQVGIPRAFVQAYLLDGKIFVYANDTISGHYLGFKTFNLSDLQLDTSKDQPITLIAAVGLALTAYYVWGVVEDIEIYDNGWLEKICYHPDYNDIYGTIFFLKPLFKTGTIIKLGSNAATKLGILPKTIKITKDGLNVSSNLFLTLLAEQFDILDSDLLRICFYRVKYLNVFLPIIEIEDIELHRTIENKITLTWGENPRDIDAHLWTPPINGNTYHIYFSNKGSLTQLPYASLDVDVVTSYGPENLTIKTLYPGTYKIAVHHYAGTGTITTSGAFVKILSRTYLSNNLNVPTGSSGANWWWYVGDIDGTTKAFTLKNLIQSSPPYPVDNMPTK